MVENEKFSLCLKVACVVVLAGFGAGAAFQRAVF